MQGGVDEAASASAGTSVRGRALRAGGIALISAVTLMQAGYWNATSASLGETSTLLIALLFAAALATYAAFTAEQPEERAFWRLLTLIGLLLASGRVYLAFVPVPEQVLPNVANVCDLAAAVTFLAALVTATRLGYAALAARLRYLIDILAALTVAFAGAYAFALHPLAAEAHVTPAARLTMAGYVSAGGLLLLGTLTAVVTPARKRPAWEWFLSAGLIVFGAASLAWPWWDVALKAGTDWWGTPALEVAWVAGVGLIGLAALFRVTSPPAEGWTPPDVALSPTAARPASYPAWTLYVAATTVLAVGGWLVHDSQPVLSAAAVSLGALAVARAAVSAVESAKRGHWSDLDPLTGLRDAPSFRRLLDEELALARRHADRPCVAVTELQGISLLNQLYGARAGDRALRAVASALPQTGAPLFSRLGGTTFAFVADGPDHAERIAEAIRAALHDAITGPPLPAATGAAVFPEHGGDAETLLENAWRACVAAKWSSPGQFVVFDSLDEAPSREWHAEESRIRSAYQALRLVAEALDARSVRSRGHSTRVADLAMGLAGRLGLSPPRRRSLHAAAILHDVGKLMSDDVAVDVVTTPDQALLQRHAAASARLLEEAGFRAAVQIVAEHHEPWNGDPAKPSLESRILAVCDAYDRYVEHRGEPEAREALVKLSGGPLDPELTAELLLMLAVRRAS